MEGSERPKSLLQDSAYSSFKLFFIYLSRRCLRGTCGATEVWLEKPHLRSISGSKPEPVVATTVAFCRSLTTEVVTTNQAWDYGQHPALKKPEVAPNSWPPHLPNYQYKKKAGVFATTDWTAYAWGIPLSAPCYLGLGRNPPFCIWRSASKDYAEHKLEVRGQRLCLPSSRRPLCCLAASSLPTTDLRQNETHTRPPNLVQMNQERRFQRQPALKPR